jgi:hypothetical protein
MPGGPDREPNSRPVPVRSNAFLGRERSLTSPRSSSPSPPSAVESETQTSGQAQGAPGTAVGQPADAQRTRSWRKASRPYQPDLDAHVAGNRRRRDLVRRGKGRGGKVHGERCGDTPVTCSGSTFRNLFSRSRGSPVGRSYGRRERFEGQGRHPGERHAATQGDLHGRGTKRDEPQGRERVAIHAPGIGGGNRRGGAKPRGRNAEVAVAGTSRRQHPARGVAGSGLRYRQYDGGVFFGQSQERQSSRVTDWTDGDGRCRERWHGKVRRVARTWVYAYASGPGEGPRRASAPRAPKHVRRAVAKPIFPRLHQGTSPHLAARPPSGAGGRLGWREGHPGFREEPGAATLKTR